jgi:ketosteroid isomerase-like protein
MPVSDRRVQLFIEALSEAERSKEVGLLPAMFTADASMASIALRKPHEGVEGTRQFWTDYLAVFRDVRSEFIHTHVNGDLAVLEWRSRGTLADGAAIDYQGVSIVEFRGDKICRFRTYYDSAAFVPDGAKNLGREPLPAMP